MKNMTNIEAHQAMCEGYKVTHYNFTPSEYLFLNSMNSITTEDGYSFGEQFWETDWMQDGWTIYKESDKVLLSHAVCTVGNHYVESVEISLTKYEKPWHNSYGNKRNIYKGK